MIVFDLLGGSKISNSFKGNYERTFVKSVLTPPFPVTMKRIKFQTNLVTPVAYCLDFNVE
jgi:hypothetical protein